jgi:sec-independent protein translocase protein TatB
MFDLSSTKLLILGVVALLVVGPKDLPVLLRAIGKYVAMIRRQADEFRAQFNDAMRETELDKIKQDVEAMGRDLRSTVSDAEAKFNAEIASANAAMETAVHPLEGATASPTAAGGHPAPTSTALEPAPAAPPPGLAMDVAAPSPPDLALAREPAKTGA